MKVNPRREVVEEFLRDSARVPGWSGMRLEGRTLCGGGSGTGSRFVNAVQWLQRRILHRNGIAGSPSGQAGDDHCRKAERTEDGS